MENMKKETKIYNEDSYLIVIICGEINVERFARAFLGLPMCYLEEKDRDKDEESQRICILQLKGEEEFMNRRASLVAENFKKAHTHIL